MATALKDSQELLRGFEHTALATTAQMLSETAQSLAETQEKQEKMRVQEWMDSEGCAAYLGKSRDALEKIKAQTDIPRHYLTGRAPMFNRREVDEWLLSR